MSFVLTIGIIASLHRDAWADEWQHVQSLEPGTRIRIVTTGGVYTATGKVTTSDSARIVIATARGEQSIARERVIRIDRDQAFLRAAPWIGMAIGAVWAGVAVAHESDFTKGGRLLWTGIGAGIGLGAGTVTRLAFRFEPVYVANLKPRIQP